MNDTTYIEGLEVRVLELEERVSKLEKRVDKLGKKRKYERGSEESLRKKEQERKRQVVNRYLDWREAKGLPTPEGTYADYIHGAFSDWAALNGEDVGDGKGVLMILTYETQKRYGLTCDKARRYVRAEESE